MRKATSHGTELCFCVRNPIPIHKEENNHG